MSGALYLDLDGTLLGAGASLLHDGDGAVSLLGVRAIEVCLRAGIEVVLMSGRRRAQVAEDARLLGQSAFIYEAGCVLALDGEELWMTELVPGERSVHEQIDDSGAPSLLLGRYAGRLEYHDPWHRGREVSHLFRGLLDVAEADALLAAHGHANLRLVDNGAVTRHAPRATLEVAPESLRAYHLIPAGGSKAAAVARHMRARGLSPASTFAVGDSREDLAVAGVVGTFWLVANALERDPAMREALRAHRNARICDEGHGAGVYEAVVTTLARRGGASA
ncbi:MAG: HAD family phosphatase [Solirubrobacteraceae bacterium]